MRLAKIALVLCLAAAGAAQAGTVTVSFAQQPPRFSDAGDSLWEDEQNLQTLASHLVSLGRTLPADQALKIEVIDVDLAGHMRHSRRHPGQLLRVVRGGADVPRITLRYTLESGGRVLRSAEETVSDLDYTRRAGTALTDGALYYERRMLTRWFSTRFATP